MTGFLHSRMGSPAVSRCVNLLPVVDSVTVANFCEGPVGGVFLACSLFRGRRLEYAGVVCSVPMAGLFIFAGTFFLIELFCCSFKEVRDFSKFLHEDALKFARASDPLGVERVAMAMSLPCLHLALPHELRVPPV